MEASIILRDLLSSLTLLVIILNYTSYTHCVASEGTIAVKINGNNSTRLDQLLIANQDLELEFQMPSEITQRVLQSPIQFKTSRSSNPASTYACDRPNTPPCGPQRNKRYTIPPNCNNYYRGACK